MEEIKMECDTIMVYRVLYGSALEKEALFTEKEVAEAFSKLINGQLSHYRWQVQIEK